MFFKSTIKTAILCLWVSTEMFSCWLLILWHSLILHFMFLLISIGKVFSSFSAEIITNVAQIQLKCSRSISIKSSKILTPCKNSDYIVHWINREYYGCFPLEWSWSGSVIQDHSDHGASKGPKDPCPGWIHRFVWCTVVRVISEHRSWPDHPKGTHPKESKLM